MEPPTGLTAISLDYESTTSCSENSNYLEPLQIVSDYADPSTIKIKKPKKKKQKNTPRVTALLDDEANDSSGIVPMVDDTTPAALTSTKRAYNEDSGLGDDEELQEILSQRRRQALKKRNFPRQEDLGRNIRQAREDEGVGLNE